MSTKTFTFAIILASIFSSFTSAQETNIYSIDFRTNDTTSWTINNAVTVPGELGTVWSKDSQYGMKATGYTSASNTRYETNSMLVSPSIDLTNFSSAYWTFEHVFRYGSLDEISVWCNDGNNWKQLTIPTYPTGEDWNFVSSGSIDLSAYAGKIIKLGYKYTSSSSIAGTWEIRQMDISGTPKSGSVEVLSVSEFLDLKSTTTINSVQGVVQYIDNTTYGNFYLADIDNPNKQIYIYGLLTKDGTSKKFYTLNIEQGDTLTLKGKYYPYTAPGTGNTTDEISNGVYVSHSKAIIDTDWSDDLNGRWSAYSGQSHTFTQPMYICGFNGESALYIASSRLLSPEETGVGLPNDSIRYRERVRFNNASLIRLTNVTSAKQYRLGSRILNLQATITGERVLQAAGQLSIEPNERPTAPPSVGNARLRICGANIENYFYNWNGAYAGAGSAEQFNVQTEKVSKALRTLDADIYALCEIENGQEALQHLVGKMNNLAGSTIYSYVDDGTTSTQSVKCAYIYRADKVTPYGGMMHPYDYASSIWYTREVIQGFRELSTSEKIVVAINHLKAKSGATSYNQDRMTEVGWLTETLQNVPNQYDDPDIIMFGDYNSYSAEEPIKYLVSNGYKDELSQRLPNEYSYVYNSTVGYLDHIFTSETMSKQVTGAAVWHVNADESELSEYSHSDESIYRYSDHDPVLIGLRLGEDVSTGLEELKHDGEQGRLRYASTQTGKIILISKEKQPVDIYSMSGNKLFSISVNGTTTVSLPRGIYLLFSSGHTYKCIVP